jgi:hypothetical protein
MDIRLAVDLDPASILDDLARSSGEGVRFHQGVRLGPNDPSVTRLIAGAEYVVAFARKATDETRLEDAVRAFREKTEARVLRKIDGIGKWIDARHYVTSIAIGGEERAREAGIEGDIVCLRVVVRITQSGGVKIAEVCEAIGLADPGIPIRTELFGENRTSLFELDRLRQARISEAAP